MCRCAAMASMFLKYTLNHISQWCQLVPSSWCRETVFECKLDGQGLDLWRHQLVSISSLVRLWDSLNTQCSKLCIYYVTLYKFFAPKVTVAVDLQKRSKKLKYNNKKIKRSKPSNLSKNNGIHHSFSGTRDGIVSTRLNINGATSTGDNSPSRTDA